MRTRVLLSLSAVVSVTGVAVVIAVSLRNPRLLVIAGCGSAFPLYMYWRRGAVLVARKNEHWLTVITVVLGVIAVILALFTPALVAAWVAAGVGFSVAWYQQATASRRSHRDTPMAQLR